jgi:HD superfamily phosphohydrolase
VDNPFFQRLRNVKQLGFADLAFPGATHSRYSHSLGAMHVATRLFDVLFPARAEDAVSELPRAAASIRPPPLLGEDRARLRQAVRLAVLFHDCGHAPLSHTTEHIMPNVSALKIPRPPEGPDRQASHEDYTLKILLDSELSRTLTTQFGGDGISPTHVADLVHPGPVLTDPWLVDGLDYGPVLRQLVSSELDADRMDYLQRDSFYSGVNYGKFDADWLIQNVVPVVDGDRVHLGIASRAIFSFEDFLLSRYHMFLTVYYHHTPTVFGEMLARYFDSAPGEYEIPADVEQFVAHDDMRLWMVLRQSRNKWADRICNRRAFKLLKEETRYEVKDPGRLADQLKAAGMEAFEHTSKGVLSKYFMGSALGGRLSHAAIYVVDEAGHTTPVEEYTPLYKRYADTVRVWRLYVDGTHTEAALRLLASNT